MFGAVFGSGVWRNAMSCFLPNGLRKPYTQVRGQSGAGATPPCRAAADAGRSRPGLPAELVPIQLWGHSQYDIGPNLRPERKHHE